MQVSDSMLLSKQNDAMLMYAEAHLWATVKTASVAALAFLFSPKLTTGSDASAIQCLISKQKDAMLIYTQADLLATVKTAFVAALAFLFPKS